MSKEQDELFKRFQSFAMSVNLAKDYISDGARLKGLKMLDEALATIEDIHLSTCDVPVAKKLLSEPRMSRGQIQFPSGDERHGRF